LLIFLALTCVGGSSRRSYPIAFGIGTGEGCHEAEIAAPSRLALSAAIPYRAHGSLGQRVDALPSRGGGNGSGPAGADYGKDDEPASGARGYEVACGALFVFFCAR